jgi:excisionase family DNA binding protein
MSPNKRRRRDMTQDRKNKRVAVMLERRGIDPTPELIQEILTTSEAANYVRLGKPTMERFRLTGEGPSYCKLGGAVRYRKADLDEWLESRLTRSTSAREGGRDAA